MTITEPTETELEALEARAAEHLAEHEGRVEDELETTEVPTEPGEPVDTGLDIRYAIAIAFAVLAAAVMVGGVFIELEGRLYAALAGLLGLGLAFALRRVRNPWVANILIAVGVFAIGLAMVVPTGLPNVARVGALASESAASGDVLRPPVPFDAGWHAIVGWLMGIVGFGAGWVALVVRRPALALLLPLPVAAIGGISVPDSDQIASGLIVLVLFAVGLGVLSSASAIGEADERPPLAYEVRRAVRAVPLIAVITIALYGLAQADFLFPEPYIDPTKEPQLPKAVPLTEVPDRVLFTVDSSLSGPWRQGSLDVYDGENWRLPPFADSELDDVPRTGIVDPDLEQGVSAEFTIAGLEGAVLPALPNTVGIAARGPQLAYDARSGNIRLAQGQIQAGLTYTVTAATLPSVDDLRSVTAPLPAEMAQFAEIPDAPSRIAGLIEEVEERHGNAWDRFDELRTMVLETVVASGAGTPVAVPPERVEDLLFGTKKGSPYEIVAAQAMLARWIGVPSRIGYGFDGGEMVGGVLEVRPRNGATFVEVYFPGFKWLPVIGTPQQAEPTVGTDPSLQQFDLAIEPSNEAGVQLFLPVFLEPPSELGRQVLVALLIIVPLIALAALLYILWPLLAKTRMRARRRSLAQAEGPRGRLAAAYADWRDFTADFGFGHASETPLMYLDRFVHDDQHNELAWLVTRGLWGDLQHQLTPEHAAKAEGLSRDLRRRLASAQPATVRAVALVSRISLREPYAPELAERGPRRPKKERHDEPITVG